MIINTTIAAPLGGGALSPPSRYSGTVTQGSSNDTATSQQRHSDAIRRCVVERGPRAPPRGGGALSPPVSLGNVQPAPPAFLCSAPPVPPLAPSSKCSRQNGAQRVRTEGTEGM
eukprot:4264695-Pyramimonas_sp.AAC.2